MPSDQDNKRLQELEARLLAEEKRHHEELRQFAYAVSHDLREPIRMIVSYTQLLDRRYQVQLDGDGREFMQYILDATQRMDRLLGDLLTYSHQFRAADQPLEMVEPEGALNGVLLMLEAEVRESGAGITHDPLPPVNFDFAQLSQLFRQLIANAIRFRGTQPLKIHVWATDIGARFSFRFATTASVSTRAITSKSSASSNGCMAASFPAPASASRFARGLWSNAAAASGLNPCPIKVQLFTSPSRSSYLAAASSKTAVKKSRDEGAEPMWTVSPVT